MEIPCTKLLIFDTIYKFKINNKIIDEINKKINLRAILFTHELSSHKYNPVNTYFVVYALLLTLAVHTVSTTLT